MLLLARSDGTKSILVKLLLRVSPLRNITHSIQYANIAQKNGCSFIENKIFRSDNTLDFSQPEVYYSLSSSTWRTEHQACPSVPR